MLFKFNVNTTDEDYLDYNIFWMTKSHYGKKSMVGARNIFLIIAVVISLLIFVKDGFSLHTAITIIPYLIAIALLAILYKPFCIWLLKVQIKSMKRQGKLAYSPISDMEFYEEYFTETTPDNKTEQKYTSVERVSILANKTMYIHVNNVMSYILLYSSFESEEQYEKFLAFIKTKCENIDTF